MNEPKPPPRDIMSDTPRVDAFWESDEMICASTEAWSLVQNFARQLERELAQAQSELRREKHAYDAAVNSHREYVRSIQAAVVDTIGGTVEGQPTHEGNYLQRLRGLMTELTQAQARCAEVEKALKELLADITKPYEQWAVGSSVHRARIAIKEPL